jgi:cell shape-determining protein MreC
MADSMIQINKTSTSIAALLFSAWLFLDSYFAHANELRAARKESQVKNWSMEQSLNYMQQVDIKRDLRRELSKKKPDKHIIEDLKETNKILKTRSNHLQILQDEVTLDGLKEAEKYDASKFQKVIDAITED